MSLAVDIECLLKYFLKLDYDLVDYVGQLREGILEAYTGIVTGLKKSEKGSHSQYLAASIADDPLLASLLLPHSQNVLELVQRCLADDERSDTLTRTAYGLIGDLAECFSGGQLKQLFLSQWVANELRSRARMPEETRKTMRWAREVSFHFRLVHMHQLLTPFF
jgi:importin subunit beta-1